jgi:deazaflavin-dependent oxidoreductase (nitroreductase family)
VTSARCNDERAYGVPSTHIAKRKQAFIMAQQITPKPNKLARGSVPAYRPSSWIMRRVVNPLTLLLVGRLGLDDHNGTRVLEVRGRTSGVWRATPVRLLELNGQRYLVAPQGQTDWARNLRARGSGRMRLGGHITAFQAVELSDEEKLPVLRAYFTRWWNLAAQMTSITSPAAPDDELLRAAPLHPVFRLIRAEDA